MPKKRGSGGYSGGHDDVVLGCHAMQKFHETPMGIYSAPESRACQGKTSMEHSQSIRVANTQLVTNKNVEQNGNDTNRYTIVLPHYNLR